MTRPFVLQSVSDLVSVFVSLTPVVAVVRLLAPVVSIAECASLPADRPTRRLALNEIIYKCFSSLGIPASDEPLTRLGGKRPDGLTLVPCCMCWQSFGRHCCQHLVGLLSLSLSRSLTMQQGLSSLEISSCKHIVVIYIYIYVYIYIVT